MTFLLLEIAGWLVAMFALGVAFGWTIRARRLPRLEQPTDIAGPQPVLELPPGTGAPAEADSLADALARLNHEKSRLAAKLADVEGSPRPAPPDGGAI